MIIIHFDLLIFLTFNTFSFEQILLHFALDIDTYRLNMKQQELLFFPIPHDNELQSTNKKFIKNIL